jgi:hypothetical protein
MAGPVAMSDLADVIDLTWRLDGTMTPVKGGMTGSAHLSW